MTVSQKFFPVEIEKLDATLKTLLTQTAKKIGATSGCFRRLRKVNPEAYAQALTFGWLTEPNASYTQLQELLAMLGCDVATQSLEDRMNLPASTQFFRELLAATLGACVHSQAVESALFEHFEGVYLQDGTIISLPNELKERYKGFGGNTADSGLSAMRVQVRLNLSNGAMQGPWLQQAVDCERNGEGSIQEVPLPKNALYVVDSLYPTMTSMKQMTQDGQWWLTHMRADVNVFDEQGVQYTLPQFVAKQQGDAFDVRVRIGSTKTTRQWVRVMGFRVSEQRAKQRRDQVGAQSSTRRKGSRRDVGVGKKHQPATKAGHHRHRPGKKRIELSEWTILVSNVEQDTLTAEQARALMRARWQIELLWRLWKERGLVDIWRSEKPERILTEVYAKLLGLVIQHWIILLGCWQDPNRSMVKASLVVRMVSTSYAFTIAGPLTSKEVLLKSKQGMKRCRLNQSRAHPSTARLLHNAAPGNP